MHVQHALDEESVKNSNIDDLTPGELDALSSWEDSYKQKYILAGEIVDSVADKVRKEAEEQKRYDAETARLAAEAASKPAAKM